MKKLFLVLLLLYPSLLWAQPVLDPDPSGAVTAPVVSGVSSGGTLSGLTTGNIPVATAADALGDSGITATKGTANNLKVTGGTATNPIVLEARGSDTNIGLTLLGKGPDFRIRVPIHLGFDSTEYRETFLIGDQGTPGSVGNPVDVLIENNAGLFVVAQDDNDDLGAITSWLSTNAAGGINFSRVNGTFAAPTKALAGQAVGVISAGGYKNSTSYVFGGHLSWTIDQDADVGGAFTLHYAPNNSVDEMTLSTSGLSLVHDATIGGLTANRIAATDGSKKVVSTISSANLAASVSDENGSGNLIFAAGTLAIASGKTATINNTLTFTGTDSSSVAFGAGGTVLYSGGALGTPSSGTGTNLTGIPPAGITGTAAILAANTFTGVQTLTVNGALSAPGLTATGTWISGGSATTTKPYVLIEPTGTTSAAWNTNGSGLGINAASGFAGWLIDAQLAGSPKFRVYKDGDIYFSAARIQDFGSGQVGIGPSADAIYIHATGISAVGRFFGFRTSFGGSDDLLLYRDAAATLQLGVDAASPVAQIVKGHDGSGTDKTGASLAIAGGNGTGTGAGGTVIFTTTAAAGGSASTQNAPTTRMTITAPGKVLIADLTTTGAATGKTIVCVDTSTGQLYASSSGVACTN